MAARQVPAARRAGADEGFESVLPGQLRPEHLGNDFVRTDAALVRELCNTGCKLVRNMHGGAHGSSVRTQPTFKDHSEVGGRCSIQCGR